MIEILVQRLRTCAPEERRDVAMRLAQTGTEEAVGELMNMVSSGVSRRLPAETSYRDVLERPHWWSRTRVKRQEPYQYDPSEHYDGHDQLIGVEALAETGSKIALRYLQELIKYDHKSEWSLTGQVQGSDFYPDWQHDSYSFPNARGELAERLALTSTHGVCESGESPEQGAEYQLIELVITKLKKSLGAV
jgi:hypothetical protein